MRLLDWGEHHLDFLRRFLPFDHGVPGGRWLTILMNRISPLLFSEAFTARVREACPDQPDFVAIDGREIPSGPSEPDGMTAFRQRRPCVRS